MLERLMGGTSPVAISALDAEEADLTARLPAVDQRFRDMVADCLAEDSDLARAQPIAVELRRIKDRLAAIPAERARAMTAEEQRLAKIEAKRIDERRRNVAARSGELSTSAKALDVAVAEIAKWVAKADQSFSALQAVLPETAWPPGAWSLVGDTVQRAVEDAVNGRPVPSITDALQPLRQFLSETSAQLGQNVEK